MKAYHKGIENKTKNLVRFSSKSKGAAESVIGQRMEIIAMLSFQMPYPTSKCILAKRKQQTEKMSIVNNFGRIWG